MARALINVPRKARRGEVIEIKALLSHPMETGYRRDNVGSPIPRDIISRFVCTYNGMEVFQADLFSAIAANPFLSFFMVAAAKIRNVSQCVAVARVKTSARRSRPPRVLR